MYIIVLRHLLGKLVIPRDVFEDGAYSYRRHRRLADLPHAVLGRPGIELSVASCVRPMITTEPAGENGMA